MSADNHDSVEFSGLILGFCSAALSYMGFGHESISKNLSLAKQNIDIIRLLREKTKGNLNNDEERLINEALDDLHRKYLEASKG